MKYFVQIAFLFIMVGAFGCEDAHEHEHEHEHEYDEDYDTQYFELRRSGQWKPPVSIENRAKTFSIRRKGAGKWYSDKRSCSASRDYTPATKSLRDMMRRRFPQIISADGYSCRHINGNSRSTSVHATGRAIDLHFRLDRGSADNDLGDPAANYLLEHAQELGVQTIIWDRGIWMSNKARSGVRYYSGAHAHHDHIHVELTPTAKVNPTVSDSCTDKIKASGSIIDNTSNCFKAFGKQKYWRKANNGYGGTLIWTNAFHSSAPSNWAKWNLNFEKAGPYTVYYHSNSRYAKYDSTQYRIRGNKQEESVYVDQSAGGDGWEELGTFDFAKGADQWVSLYDNSSIAIEKNQHIVADAIRVVPGSIKGGIRITLKWLEATDSDIHVITPFGNEISPDIDGKIAADGGRLIKDECYSGACFSETRDASNPHLEIVEWNSDNLIEGEFEVWAENFNGKSTAKIEISFLYPDGKEEIRKDTLGGNRGDESQHFIFTYKK